MKIEKQFGLILQTLFVSLTISRGMDVLLEPYREFPFDEILKNVEKNSAYRSFSILIEMNNHTSVPAPVEIPTDRLPILIGEDSSDEIFTLTDDSEYPTNITENNPIGNDTVNQSDDFSIEILTPTEDSNSPTNNTLNNFIGNDDINPSNDSSVKTNTPTDDSKIVRNITVDNITYHLLEDPESDFTYDPKEVYIRPEPKIFSAQVQEFHECVSCNADPGARKNYEECLQKLSFKNQEVVKSCCNTSFEDEFCQSAASGKIDYETICSDPSKAIKADYCFWLKVEDKNTDDIQKYRECKEQIVEDYCTIESPADVE